MDRLSAIRAALIRELSGNDARLRFVNTRLILGIGVDLDAISLTDDDNPERVRLTLSTLQKMGFLKRTGDSKEGANG